MGSSPKLRTLGLRKGQVSGAKALSRDGIDVISVSS